MTYFSSTLDVDEKKKEERRKEKKKKKKKYRKIPTSVPLKKEKNGLQLYQARLLV